MTNRTKNAANHVRGEPRGTPLAACLALTFAIGDIACASVAAAATRQVTNCNDAGSGSLRETLAGAQSGDTVDLRSLSCERIAKTSGELTVAAKDLVLQGPGAGKLTIPGIEHGGVGTLRIDSLRIADCVRGVASNGTVSISDSIVTACSGTGIIGKLGLILRNSTVSNNGYTGVVVAAGNTTIDGSTVSGNHGGYCGALSASGAGTVTIANTTISGNTATWSTCIQASSVTIANSTIAFSADTPFPSLAGPGGIGLFTNAPQLKLESTIFANNVGTDILVSTGTVVSGSNNLLTLGVRNFDTFAGVPAPAGTLNADPLLLPLANNGGATMTHALRAESPAIDAGNNAVALLNDQRGAPFLRSAGARPDIGAFESQAAPPMIASIGPGYTGSWFDAAQSGHGFSIEVLPGNVMLAAWYVYAPLGGQAWIVGTGPIAGNSAVIQGFQKVGSGGAFPPAFNAAQLQDQFWGTVTLTFTDCNNGSASWAPVAPGYSPGSMPLQRLTLPAGLSCP